MQWGEFQVTAARLAQGQTEGDWRSAVSRAYYAAFHYFRQFLLSRGADIGKAGQAHFNLYAGLNHCGFAQVADVAKRIDELRIARTDADYDLRRQIAQPFALHWVQEGQRVVSDFTALLNTLPPAQIAAGAKKHLQSIGRIP